MSTNILFQFLLTLWMFLRHFVQFCNKNCGNIFAFFLFWNLKFSKWMQVHFFFSLPFDYFSLISPTSTKRIFFKVLLMRAFLLYTKCWFGRWCHWKGSSGLQQWLTTVKVWINLLSVFFVLNFTFFKYIPKTINGYLKH